MSVLSIKKNSGLYKFKSSSLWSKSPEAHNEDVVNRPKSTPKMSTKFTQ